MNNKLQPGKKELFTINNDNIAIDSLSEVSSDDIIVTTAKKYILSAFVLSFAFIFIATVTESLAKFGSVSFANLFSAQLTSPLLWLTDLLPLIAIYIAYRAEKKFIVIEQDSIKLKQTTVLYNNLKKETENKKVAEERFRVLFEQSTNAHLLFDETGIIDCNNAAIVMLGCKDKAELLSLHPAVLSPEFQPDGKSSADKAAEMDALAREKGFHRFEWIHRKMDGKDFPVEVTLNPVLINDKATLLVVWHDISERKQYEKEILEANEAAEQNRMITEAHGEYLQTQISRMLDSTRKVAGGDLNVHIVSEVWSDNDGVHELVGSINLMVQELKTIISKVKAVTGSVNNTAGMITKDTKGVLKAASEQAMQISQILKAIEEMVASIEENNNNVNFVARLADDNNQIALKGAEKVKHTVELMDEISQEINNSAGKVNKLGEGSKKISEIVNVINDIADQTNLLALNAAIEAARAGEAGRGFSVVAAEIRKLSERTSKATKEVGLIIAQNNQDTEEAIKSMSKGIKVVSNGVSFASEAGKSLEEIEKGINNLKMTVMEFASAFEEQRLTSSGVMKNAEHINGKIREVINTADNAVNSSIEIEQSVEELSSLISRFRV